MQTRDRPAGDRVRTPELMRKVNLGLRALSADFDTPHPIGFFCECTADDCYGVVWLSATEFETHVTRPDAWLLAAGHNASPAAKLSPADSSDEVCREALARARDRTVRASLKRVAAALRRTQDDATSAPAGAFGGSR
jgi:hypothetical protein